MLACFLRLTWTWHRSNGTFRNDAKMWYIRTLKILIEKQVSSQILPQYIMPWTWPSMTQPRSANGWLEESDSARFQAVINHSIVETATCYVPPITHIHGSLASCKFGVNCGRVKAAFYSKTSFRAEPTFLFSFANAGEPMKLNHSLFFRIFILKNWTESK